MPLDGGSSLLTLVLIFGGFLVLMYFVSVRPMKRQMQEQQARINSLQVGMRVMLTSGIFGTVKHIGETQLVVELAPGQEITVLKQAVKDIVNPEMEEFVFDDSDAEGDLTEAADTLSTGADDLSDSLNPESPATDPQSN